MACLIGIIGTIIILAILLWFASKMPKPEWMQDEQDKTKE